MSRLDRCREKRRRTGQHHGGPTGKLILLAILLSCPALPQSILHIRVLEGESAIHAPGAKARSGIVVQVTDETGRPVEGAAVSFRLPDEGPGGAFAHGMKTEIATTTPDGRAAVYGFECNRITGPFQIRVTAVKQPVRAGMIVSQYISDKVPAARASNLVRQPSSRRKWILIGSLAGAAAISAALLGPGRGAGPSAAPPAAPPQIGTPTITIGKP